MMKFKTLFRKGHGCSNSGSGTKNKNNNDRVKANHFESAVTISNNSASNYDNNEFEKPAVTSSIQSLQLSKLNSDVVSDQNTFVKENSVSKMLNEPCINNETEFESVKKQLETVFIQKNNLEFALQELIQSHGDIEALRKEIEHLKVCI